MRHLLVLALMLPAAAASERVIVGFRLKKDPRATVRGWALDVTEKGMRVERIGGSRRFFVAWDDLVDADHTKLRERFRLDPSEDERLGLLSGHRLHFKGGGAVEGLLERVDADGRHWLKREGFPLPYPGDRVVRVEEIKVKEADVFDGRELYERRIERVPPRTAAQHRILARHLYDTGDLEKSEHHYRAALRLKPAWYAEINARLKDIELLAADDAARDALRKVRTAYRLRKDYAGAEARLREFIAANPDRKRLAQKMLDDLEEARVGEMRKRFNAVKHEEFDRVVDRFLRTHPDLEQALAWVRAQAEKETRKAIARRLGTTDGQVEAFLEDEKTGSPHWASYESGSFIFSKRAHKGKSTRKAIRGDPDRWWDQYGDLETRAGFLRAYAAERLERLFEVVQVKLRDCGSCGGTGIVRHVSVKQLQDGRHEWKQVCPRCFKAARDRSVGYR